MSTTKLDLPKYAWPYSHPAAQRGDVGAQFYDDDNSGTICVSIERMECGQLCLETLRGGIADGCFTRCELAKVLELAGILFKSI